MAQLNMERLHSQLILEEGLRLMPYDDATGRPVASMGICRGKLTIGIGRNLDGNPLTKMEQEIIGHDGRTRPITHEQALMLLDHDIANVCRVLDNSIPWWEYLDEIHARVLVDLCFNMGITKLLGFRNFLRNLRTGSYSAAADDLKDSLWYKQVGTRGVRLVAMMRTGEDWEA
jgi:lysozyme